MTGWPFLLGISAIGIISFVIPLWLSFKWDLGTKLSKGEIRKSIVISFTIIYLILLLLSYDRTMDLATTNNTTFTIITLNATANATAQTVPIQAIGNFTQNFLYVYIVIIGFYFGSRLGEQVKMLKELSNLHSIDIVKRRYAMGEIDFKTFGKMRDALLPKVADELKKLAESYKNEELTKEEFNKQIEKLLKGQK